MPPQGALPSDVKGEDNLTLASLILRAAAAIHDWNVSASENLRGLQGHCWQLATRSVSQASARARMLFDSEIFRIYGWDWIWFGMVVAILARVNRRLLANWEESMKNKFTVLLIQLAVWSVFAAQLTHRFGVEKGFMWVHGYVLDWMLSINSAFFFHALLRYFRIPRLGHYKLLTACMCTSACCRVLLYIVLAAVSKHTDFARPFTGIMLVFLGLRPSFDFAQYKFSCHWAQVCLRWLLGSRCDFAPIYNEQDISFTSIYKGKTYISFFGFVAVVLETLDLCFVMPVSFAKVLQITDVFILSTSSVAAMFCLRAFALLVQEGLEYLFNLQYAFSGIYVVTGILTLLQRWVVLDEGFVLAVNLCMLLMGMLVVAVYQGTTSLFRSQDAWFGVFEAVPFDQDNDFTDANKTKHVDANVYDISKEIVSATGFQAAFLDQGVSKPGGGAIQHAHAKARGRWFPWDVPG